jgi:protein-disulfide isomerase
MDKRFLIILGALVVIFGAIIAFSGGSKKDSGGTNNSGAQPTNHIEGQGQKGVKLVEYGDFECPICGIYYQPLKQLQTQFDKDITFQFRNLPLISIHKNAFAAARAAEAAAEQGKYWQMHDALYDNQDPSGQSGWVASNDALNQYFVDFAKQIGLNETKFKSDYASSKVNDAVNADLAAFGETHQQQATPTFFLDGKYLSNSEFSDAKTGQPSLTKMADVINKEIAAKNKK